MAAVLDMSMSLDGFIAGLNVSPDNGLGDGGERLHEWVFPEGHGGDLGEVGSRLSGVNREMFDALMATGAVVAGRGTFEPAEGWGGDHHDGVPIWILSRHPAPGWAAEFPLVTYTADLAGAMAAAKAAAGRRDVLVHGAGIAARGIPLGLIEELMIHVVPVLFGAGRALFAEFGVKQRELELVEARAGEGGVVHLRYRVR